MSTAIVRLPEQGQELYRTSTNAASACKEIVVATAMTIQGRKYVKVEGWQAIAIAHGCIASSGDVERISDQDCPGYRAIGKIIRMDNGQVLATAEGFVGDDEKAWSSRPVYARRAMAQTRAISRACRSAFAHVVVMMNAGLETTPAEEVPHEGFEPAPTSVQSAKSKIRAAAEALGGETADPKPNGEFVFDFGKHNGKHISEVPASYLAWLRNDVKEKLDSGQSRDEKKSRALLAALDAHATKKPAARNTQAASESEYGSEDAVDAP